MSSLDVINKITQAKTKKARRVLKQREPKLVENPKRLLFLCGGKTSATIKDAFSFLNKLAKYPLPAPAPVRLDRRHDNVRPMEPGGETELERFCRKYDCGLYVLGTHSKKRPHCLTIGRCFDYQLYEALEVMIQQYQPLRVPSGLILPSASSRPALIFTGPEFNSDTKLIQFKSLMIDMLRGPTATEAALKHLDRALVFSVLPEKSGAGGGSVMMKQCKVALKKSGSRVPTVELVDIGPSLTMLLGRYREPSSELYEQAVPKVLPRKPTQAKKRKNVGHEEMQGQVGKVFMPQQDLGEVNLRKAKGFKRERREEAIARKTAKDT